MKYIALTGKIASGKTAVAKALQAKGYMLISYTDLLKRLLADALTSIGFPTTLEDILADKQSYRALIQEFGSVIGFDNGGVYVEKALLEWKGDNYPKAVFDNIRTDSQAGDVIDAGFTIVRLTASDLFRHQRIEGTGANLNATLRREQHRIELGVSESLIDLSLATDFATPEMIAEFLSSLEINEPGPETTEQGYEVTHG